MTKIEQTDEWLMLQVKKGHADYVDPIIRRYADPILTYLVRATRDRHRAEELFQDVFQAVWEKRKTYKFPKPFRPWLYTIAANRYRSDYRKRKPIPKEFADTDSVPAKDSLPDQPMIQKETSSLLKSATEKLPEQQRQVLTMRVWNELSYAEIAKSLGIAEVTARSNMHHALVALRRTLKRELQPGANS